MKTKILSLFTLSMLFAFGANAKCYYCTQTDTKPWGCDKITETSNEDRYVLECSGPGDKVCQFSDGTCPRGISPITISEYIRAQVANGKLSGKVVYPMGYYTWAAEDASNFSYIVFED